MNGNYLGSNEYVPAVQCSYMSYFVNILLKYSIVNLGQFPQMPAGVVCWSSRFHSMSLGGSSIPTAQSNARAIFVAALPVVVLEVCASLWESTRYFTTSLYERNIVNINEQEMKILRSPCLMCSDGGQRGGRDVFPNRIRDRVRKIVRRHPERSS